ncbi:hypothetical protein PBY51_001358 [Eleginops maclovinus]|uniref:Uncharacterized protein n=1 Tax=Eleginops maclovinus TaxID=56733 RepID=A0AAN8ACP7_ELEMC|nr:hypothetical protein PBY51_001358 [Eleginops maclovinus]
METLTPIKCNLTSQWSGSPNGNYHSGCQHLHAASPGCDCVPVCGAAAAEEEEEEGQGCCRHMWNITVTERESAEEPESRCLRIPQESNLEQRTGISL